MYGLLLAIHLLVCISLIFVVLVQSGKGGGLAGGAFGGATQTVFGGRGANDFITRATVILGVVFFVTSVSLALLTTQTTSRSRSLLQEQARKAASAPAVPAAPQQAAPSSGAPAGAPAGGTTPEQPVTPTGR